MIIEAPEACPKCGHAESWSTWIGEKKQLMGKCHRAKCGHITGLEGLAAPRQAREPRLYTRPYKALNDDQNAIIDNLFGLPDGVVDGYSEQDDRFILGVMGPQMQHRGHIAYSFSGAKPKSINYVAKTDEPFNHWARARTLKPGALVVVEDWFSAEKVREAGATGIALIGTTLNQAMVTDISHVARDWQIPTYLALDRDAFGKALAYKAKYAEQFKLGLQVWALDKDLKYESVERIKDAIESRRFNFSGSHREQGSV